MNSRRRMSGPIRRRPNTIMSLNETVACITKNMGAAVRSGVNRVNWPTTTQGLRHVRSCTNNELGFYYARRVISSRP